MRHYFFIIIGALTLLLAATACHTTEENYRKSYDLAVNKTRTGTNASDYEARIIEAVRKNAEVDGDSVRLLVKNFNVVKDSDNVAMRYSVVVGEFVQQFNAISFRDRLRSLGEPSYVVYTNDENEHIYLVVAHGYDDIALAAAYIRLLKEREDIIPTVRLPWILERVK